MIGPLFGLPNMLRARFKSSATAPEPLTSCQAAKVERNRVLRQAADLLEHRGWTTGTLESYSGEYCLIGAINAAKAKHDHSHAVADAAVSAIAEWLGPAAPPRDGGKPYGYTDGQIYRWNDGQESVRPVLDAIQGAQSMPMRVTKEKEKE